MCPLQVQHHSTCQAAKTILLACSGASEDGSVADLTARALAMGGVGTMGCLARLSAQDGSMEDEIRSADRVVAIDGCPGECVRKTLEAAGIDGFEHVRLTELESEPRGAASVEQRVAMVVHHLTQRLRDE